MKTLQKNIQEGREANSGGWTLQRILTRSREQIQIALLPFSSLVFNMLPRLERPRAQKPLQSCYTHGGKGLLGIRSKNTKCRKVPTEPHQQEQYKVSNTYVSGFTQTTHTHRRAHTHTSRQTDTHTLIDRYTHVHTYRQTDAHTHKIHTHSLIDTHTGRQADRHTHTHILTNRQAYTH